LPTKEGRIVRLDRKDGVRFRDAVFSPDDKEVLLLSDESGEFEIHQYNSLGMDSGKQISKGGTTLRFDPLPSPDGSKIAFSDLNQHLWVLDKASGESTQVSDSQEALYGAAWSPDGKWLAYVQAASNTFLQIFLFQVEYGKRLVLTSVRSNSFIASWSP